MCGLTGVHMRMCCWECQVSCYAIEEGSQGMYMYRCVFLYIDRVVWDVLQAQHSLCACVCMLKCSAAVRQAVSLICADSFVIGALDEKGNLQLMVNPQSERWRNNRGGGWVCVCVCV